MIIIITVEEKNKWTGKRETIVSHGVDVLTLKNITLPPVSPSEIGYFNRSLGEWVLKEN